MMSVIVYFGQKSMVHSLLLCSHMKSDVTYAWHGYRAGISLYYHHWTQAQERIVPDTIDISHVI